MAVLEDAGLNMGLGRNGAFGKDWTTPKEAGDIKDNGHTLKESLRVFTGTGAMMASFVGK